MNKTTEALKLSEEAKVIEKMQQDEIIRMAREAGLSIRGHYDENGSTPQELERFAALVAAHEKKFWMEQIEVECNEAVLAEREACAKVCDDIQEVWLGEPVDTRPGYYCAAAIRARSEK